MGKALWATLVLQTLPKKSFFTVFFDVLANVEKVRTNVREENEGSTIVQIE